MPPRRPRSRLVARIATRVVATYSRAMDIRLAASTFLVVFLAELGDKTQLATFALASEKGAPLSVFVGAALALTSTSAIGVVAGTAVGHAIPALWVRRAAGLLFVVLGLFYLLRR